MRRTLPILFATLLLILALPDMAAAQAEGDFRSAADGNWSDAATWETFTGGAWGAAVTAPTGAETIWITNDDSVSVEVAVSITGTVITDMSGVLEVGAGSLTFEDGAMYEHARDAGEVPESTWANGSTALITGMETDAPDNRGQDYHHLTINSSGMLSNEDFDLGGNTIGGDLHVINTGLARFRLIGGETATITLMGDVTVEADAQLETLGTGSPVDVIVNHWGNLTVNGGAFSVSRGSQGSGTGTTTWNLLMGDYTNTDGETRNSNPTPGNAKMVFAAGGTQTITFTNVEYGGGNVHFAVSDSTTLDIADGFEVNGLFVNEGEVTTQGSLTFLEESTYDHARDSGAVPMATWNEGSTALFTGLETDAPDDRGQDYWNLTINSPGLVSNEDFDLGGNTIGGDLHVINSGSARVRLIGGDDGTITLNGDVIVEADAQLETLGTGSPTNVVVNHSGDVWVNGGAFSVSRGSQGSGTGTTMWNLLGGDMTFTDAGTRNSNPTPGNAVFVFAGGQLQTLTIEGSTEDIENLSVRVATDAILDLGTTSVVGDGVFQVDAGGSVMTANEMGLDGALALEGDGEVDFSPDANLWFTRGGPQSAGAVTPDSLDTIQISNSTVVTLSDTTSARFLEILGDASLVVDATGSILAADGSLSTGASIVNGGDVRTTDDGEIFFSTGSTYEHARDGGDMPTGQWHTNSTALFTGVEADMPDNRGQNYYHLTINAPGQISNLDLDLGGNTVFGDLHVINTGLSRMRLIGGEDGTISLGGDVIVEEDAQLETLGTGSPTNVVVDHSGDVWVNGGAFSVSRGSQGSGTGTTTWNMLRGDMTFTDANTRNSNPTPGNAVFVFTGTAPQSLTIAGSNEDIENLSVRVDSDAILDLGTSSVAGDGVFWVDAGATVMTANEMGLDGALALEEDGDVNFDVDSHLTFNGETAQEAGAATPDSLGSITFDNAVMVSLKDTTSANMLYVPTGATLLADTTGSILVNGGMVDGTVVARGEVLTTDGGSIDFGATAVYEHDRDEGEMPTGDWSEGSTAMFTGIEADMPGNRGQDYWNVTVNAPNQISNLDLDLGGNTVFGDLHVINSGLSRIRLIGGEDGTITLMGDVTVEEDGQLETLGTGSPTNVVVNHYGSITNNGGGFSVSRGSQGSGTGTTTWNLFEGDMTLTDADSRNSNPTPENAKFVFAAGGTQTLTINGSTEDIDNLPIAVSDSTSLDVGTSQIVGDDIFILNAGATLMTANTAGVAGSIGEDVIEFLSEEASYTFNGTEAQVTSTLMPATVNGLTIDNDAGVTLSQATTVNGELRLVSGVFNNTIPFVLGAGGSVVFDGGSLLVDIANEVEGGDVPNEFALHQNYPNPFNPSTVIRYDIREQANVTVTVYDVMGREVTRLVDRSQAPGKYSVEWNASGLASGTYYYRIEAGNWAATRSLLRIKLEGRKKPADMAAAGRTVHGCIRNV